MDFTNFIEYLQKYNKSIICSYVNIKSDIIGVIRDEQEIYGVINNKGIVCKIVNNKNIVNNIPILKGDIISKNKLKNTKEYKGDISNMLKSDHNIYYDEESNKMIPIYSNVSDDKLKDIKTKYNKQLYKIENCKKQIENDKDKIINGIIEYKQKVNEYLMNIDNNCDIKIKEIYDKMSNEKNILKEQLLQLQKHKCDNTDIIKQLDESINELSEYKMKEIVLKGYQNRCNEKIINEKQMIIEKIKEYNEKWNEWVKNNKITTKQNILYRNKLKSEYELIKKNLKYTKTDNIKLKQNIKDITLELNNIINKQIRLLEEKDLNIKIKDSKYLELKSELKNIKKLFNTKNITKKEENTKDNIENINDTKEYKIENDYTKNTKIDNQKIDKINYNKCYDKLRELIEINNELYTIMEIVKKIDNIIYKSKHKIQNKDKIEFEKIKIQIINYISYINLDKYINSQNFQYLKSNATKNKVSKEYCKEIYDINIDKSDIIKQKDILRNIYNNIIDDINIYIRIKPLIGIEQYSKNVIKYNDKSIEINCDNKIYTYDNMYEIYDDNTLNKDIKIHSINQIKNGYNIVIMGYGSKLSGKTLTLFGNNGIPGLMYYILNELINIKQIRIKNIFKQSIRDINFNFNKIRGNIINMVNRVPQIDEQVDINFRTSINIENLNISYINTLMKDIREQSDEYGGHLYIILEIIFENGNIGYITLIEFGDNESPINIYNKYINNKTTIESVMSPKIGEDLIRKHLKNEEILPKNILKILKEQFYNNECFNHLIYYFRKLEQTLDIKKIKLQNTEQKYKLDKFFVNPKTEEKYINGANNCLIIPIFKYIHNLSENTKYEMFCNIRQELSFCDNTVAVISFANKIKQDA